MAPETQERFPIPDEAVKAAKVDHHVIGGEVELRAILAAAAPHIVQAWIDGLSDRGLLELRFATNNKWCQNLRDQLKAFTQGPA